MMPADLILVRHGESEGNVARRFSENGDNDIFSEQFCDRHSSRLRLTDLGQKQAESAERWIKQNVGEYYDRYLVSGYLRAIETGVRLKLPEARWYQNFYLRERDMGLFDIISEDEKKNKYPEVYRQYALDPFYWTPPNGESVAQLCLRIDRVLATLHRECSGKKVLIVCHGMVMWAFMILIERLTPQQFMERSSSRDPADRIRNCQIIQYTRRNPVNGILADRCYWARSICPWSLSDSRLDWRKIERPQFNNEDLMKIVEASPRFIS